MIVVSDTSPITALLQVGEDRLLFELFGEVVVPEAIRDELLKFHTSLPDWLEVHAVTNRANVEELTPGLDLGEAEAISLALEISADRLLIDGRKGRSAAQEKGLGIIGLVGVVILAKNKNLIPSAATLFDRLESTAGVYVSADLKEQALTSVGESAKWNPKNPFVLP